MQQIMKLSTRHLRLFNHGLTAIVALLAVYILIAPFAPQITWWVRHDSPVKGALPRTDVTANLPTGTSSTPNQQAIIPDGDQLIIPGLEMRETIHEGDMRALRLGIWRLPHTSTPDKGGNTVIVGHRFTYSGQAVFYHLDKVKTGDPIVITWKGKVYEYEVSNIQTVPPTQVSIEANTDDPLLTIYTCTLWTAKERLVIQAKPVGAAS
jgi:LPXTG-site transpeptidase (sortase) family protein